MTHPLAGVGVVWWRRLCALGAGLVVVGALGACATTLDGGVHADWFPKNDATAGPLITGRALLTVDAAAEGQWTETEPLRSLAAARLRIPIGRIVAHAAQQALGAALSDGVQIVGARGSETDRVAFRWVVSDVTLEVQDDLQFFLPLPPPVLWIEKRELAYRVKFVVALSAPSGAVVWARPYDSGRVVWKRPTDRDEPALDAFQRALHEGVWRLCHSALGDSRAWYDTDRMRPRQL